MKKLLTKILLRIVGVNKIIKIDKQAEARIIGEMAKIEGMDDYLQLMAQAGYQLFSRTREERYLGYVNFTESLQTQIKTIRIPEEPIEHSDGYKSTVD